MPCLFVINSFQTQTKNRFRIILNHTL